MFQLREALAVIWAGGDGPDWVATALRKYAADDQSGDLLRVFSHWAAKNATPGNRNDGPPSARTPEQYWERASVFVMGSAQQTSTLSETQLNSRASRAL